MIGMTSSLRHPYRKKKVPTMKQVKLAITGRFGRGKDTVAGILMPHLTEMAGGLGMKKLAFADALKRELAEMAFNYTTDQDWTTSEEVITGVDAFETWMRGQRDLNGLGWQWWGEYRRRTQGEDYWVRHHLLQHRYHEFQAQGCPILVTDMRHHNENQWLRNEGFYCVRVDGSNRREGESRDPNHESERYIQELQVDYVLSNTANLDILAHNVQRSLVPRIKAHFAADPEAVQGLLQMKKTDK